jgi:hypothetical protein
MHGSSQSYLVVRRKGNSPIRIVAGERFRTKKKAEKEAREWNKAYKGSDVKSARLMSLFMPLQC